MKTFVRVAATAFALVAVAGAADYFQSGVLAQSPAAAAKTSKPAKPGAAGAAAPQQRRLPYFPPAHDWKKDTPASVGMDGAKLDAAIAYAVANENPANKDLAIAQQADFGREPVRRDHRPDAPARGVERPRRAARRHRRRMGRYRPAPT